MFVQDFCRFSFLFIAVNMVFIFLKKNDFGYNFITVKFISCGLLVYHLRISL